MIFRPDYIIASQQPTPSPATTLRNSNHSTTPSRTMDVSENRLFRWSKPEWMNSSSIRGAGVYTSGALVSSAPLSRPTH